MYSLIPRPPTLVCTVNEKKADKGLVAGLCMYVCMYMYACICIGYMRSVRPIILRCSSNEIARKWYTCMYCIAGLFRGRKFLRMAGICVFCE